MKDKFWSIVNQAKKDAANFEDRAVQLKNMLMKLSPEEVFEFDKIYYQKIIEAYRWDLWGAAYVINGGCSDDGFHYFCGFLISEGEDTFNRAIEDPESLADIEIEEDAEFEDFNYVASEVYEEKTGDEMPSHEIKYPADPIGESWEENELDERYPKLTLTLHTSNDPKRCRSHQRTPSASVLEFSGLHAGCTARSSGKISVRPHLAHSGAFVLIVSPLGGLETLAF